MKAAILEAPAKAAVPFVEPPVDRGGQRSPSPLEALIARVGLDTLTSRTSPFVVESALLRLRDLLPPGTSGLSRETTRKAITDYLKARGLTGYAPMVKEALQAPARVADESDDDPEVEIALVKDDDPWPERVDGAQLLDEVSALVRKYIVLPPTSADAVALWLLGAHAADSASILPMLLITAATMGSGKSSLADVVSRLVPRGLTVSSLTPAVVFRLIDKYRPTLVADEADTWLKDEKSELRGIFNCGHSKSTAIAARCVGDEHEVKLFSVWAPKVIAMIGNPPATILDRCIVVELKKKRSDEQVERLMTHRLTVEAEPLRRKLIRFADDSLLKMRYCDPELPAYLYNRAADNWRHLFVMAQVAGGEWGSRVRLAAMAAAARKAGDCDDIGAELLADIHEVFEAGDRTWMSSADLAAALKALPDRPWDEWAHGSGLSTHRLAGQLRTFDIRTHKRREGTKTVNAYDRAAFLDAWARYLPSGRNLGTTQCLSCPTAGFGSEQPDAVFRPENADSPNDYGPCSDVPSLNGGGGPADDDNGATY